MKKSATLSDYIRSLLQDGKRAKDEEFQTLMRIYGKDRIINDATVILAELLLAERNQKEIK